MSKSLKIASFYRFCEMRELDQLKNVLLDRMEKGNILGTIIIANEGFNGTVAGTQEALESFIEELREVLGSMPPVKYSFHPDEVFKRRKVKIKNEIVTLKRAADPADALGTHLEPDEWNELIKNQEVVLIDARNDYECKVGAFKGAINPKTGSFSELPDFIESNFDPSENPTIAMYCTGGIRCEKIVSYLKSRGYGNVFQLNGGILNYLEKTQQEDSLWEGECFVFDERVTVDAELRKGRRPDFSSLIKGEE